MNALKMKQGACVLNNGKCDELIVGTENVDNKLAERFDTVNLVIVDMRKSDVQFPLWYPWGLQKILRDFILGVLL